MEPMTPFAMAGTALVAPSEVILADMFRELSLQVSDISRRLERLEQADGNQR